MRQLMERLVVPRVGSDHPLLAELGFTFVVSNGTTCLATLPVGWTHRPSYNQTEGCVDFFDHLGQRRVVVRPRKSDGVLTIIPVSRYFIFESVTDSATDRSRQFVTLFVRDNGVFVDGHAYKIWESEMLWDTPENRLLLSRRLSDFIPGNADEASNPRLHWR